MKPFNLTSSKHGVFNMSELSGKIADMVEQSVLSVFGTMANLSGEPVSKAEDATDIQLNGVGGFVNFAGPLSGAVYLLMSEQTARQVTANMLGTDEVGAGEIKDVVGELTNMVAGGLKNQLATAGLDSSLTIPTYIMGENSRISVRNTSVATKNVIRLPGILDHVQVRVLARKMP
ncbi:MAG: chemotaxis protein CheX [Verrucomicrobiales bacterium]|nr:chemotaxis protein CheX [Verrucomicrobiales bacterium]